MVVDGSKTPENVSDRLAYYHFIMATAIPTNASPEQISRREALLNPVGFSKDDHDSFVAALTQVRDDLDQVTQDRKQYSTDTVTSRAALATLKQHEDQILENARIRLQTAFSSEGVTRLNAHLRDNVKRNIKIYGALLP
jgi:hypothetical protein